MVENELHHIPWGQFQQMVPSILGLEVRRLSRCIGGATPGTDECNQMVQARHNLREFIACVSATAKEHVDSCQPLLDSALLSVMGLERSSDLSYVIDRLAYVRDRIPFVY